MSDYTSGYPEYMNESLKKVTASRPGRVGKHFRAMTADEKQQILKDYHPDWKMDQKRGLRVGSSKGQLMPHEVADILEAHSIINPKDIDLKKIDYDVDILITLIYSS